MIAGILYGPDRKAIEVLGLLLKEQLGKRSSEECALVICADGSQLQAAVAQRKTWQVVCVDIGDGSGMNRVFEARQACPAAELLLLVDAGVPPMTYIRPGVMPSCLVQRPANTTLVRESVGAYAEHLLERADEDDALKSFAIESKEGITKVPYRKIVCFESRAKRISVRLAHEEYTYYDTLDRLQKSLPEQFVRCHRGFIVNARRIRQLHLSDNSVVMDDGSVVPVSRSYKSTLKELLA